MDFLSNLVNGFLGLGSSIFMPVIIIILGIVAGVKLKKSISSGILLGVAFTGIGLVISYMTGALSPAAEAMVNRFNLSFDTLDFGWPAASAVAWAWPYAALCFPIQIGVNLLMVVLNMTKTVNVDMWNVWVKCFCGAIVTAMTGNAIIALVIVAVWAGMELVCADLMRKSVYAVTKIPGISVPHSYVWDAVILVPLSWLIEKIPFMKKCPKVTSDSLREKIGIFGENHVIGFILGAVLGLCGEYSITASLTLGVQAATAMVLLPTVAKFFMQSLTPLANAMSSFMRKRFPDRDVYIGLDWPVIAGDATMWTSAILLIPVLLLLAIVLPGNTVLPFASIVFIDATIFATVVARSDLIKTFILAVVNAVIKLYVATFFAGVVTQLAVASGTVSVNEGFSNVIWMGMGWMYWAFAKIAAIFTGDLSGILVLAGSVALFLVFAKIMRTRNKEMCAEGIYDYSEEPGKAEETASE